MKRKSAMQDAATFFRTSAVRQRGVPIRLHPWEAWNPLDNNSPVPVGIPIRAEVSWEKELNRTQVGELFDQGVPLNVTFFKVAPTSIVAEFPPVDKPSIDTIGELEEMWEELVSRVAEDQLNISLIPEVEFKEAGPNLLTIGTAGAMGVVVLGMVVEASR